MFSFTQLATFAFLAVAASASVLPEAVRRSAIDAKCANPSVVSTQSVAVGDKVVEISSVSCAPTQPVTEAKITRRNTNVCAQACSISCNQLTGILPPISEDCGIIEKAIAIFHGHLESELFTVDPNHLLTLTQGTCSYFFSNDGAVPLDSCWTGLSTNAAAAGAACYPPHQPFSPEGVCSVPYSWSIGSTHS